MNRNPLIARQIQDLEKTESQRREEQARGSGSTMVGKDKPVMHHKPPPQIRHTTDRQQFNRQWLAEYRNAALAQAQVSRAQSGRTHKQTYTQHREMRHR